MLDLGVPFVRGSLCRTLRTVRLPTRQDEPTSGFERKIEGFMNDIDAPRGDWL
jgi:hypothetical protein